MQYQTKSTCLQNSDEQLERKRLFIQDSGEHPVITFVMQLVTSIEQLSLDLDDITLLLIITKRLR